VVSGKTTVTLKRAHEVTRPIEIVETVEEKEKQQPQGFFQKYWYFIVTVVVMMVFNAVMGGANTDPTAVGTPARRR